jgi:site-specific recombinase XerD
MNSFTPPSCALPGLETAFNPSKSAESILTFWENTELPLGAENELTLAIQYLLSYRNSKDTYNTYRKELEKLLLWAWCVKKISILNIDSHDAEEFIEFCSSPPKSWIATHNFGRFEDNKPSPKWRPFVSPSSEYRASTSVIYSIFAAVNSFYDYLVEYQATEYHPFRSIRQKSKFATKISQSKVKRFSNNHMDILFRLVEDLCIDEPEKYERTRWICYLLLDLYLRVSELVHDNRSEPKMKDFETDDGGHTWLTVIGKGNKQRFVSVPDVVITALKRYRNHLGLSDFPLASESVPLVPIKNSLLKPIQSTRQIRRIMEDVFIQTADLIDIEEGKQSSQDFLSGTVHWLRHTGISEDVKHRPKEHVQDDAGHNSLATTEKYIDIEKSERAKSKNWKV